MNKYRKRREGVETLDRMLRWPGLTHAWTGKTVRIYSGEHRAFWRANGAGYTLHPIDAGVYPFADAYDATKHCGPEKEIEFHDVTKADRLREGAT